MLDAIRRNSLFLLGAALIGSASATGLSRTGALAPVPGYASRGKGPRGRDQQSTLERNRLLFAAEAKRLVREARNLRLAARGAFGSHWQVA